MLHVQADAAAFSISQFHDAWRLLADACPGRQTTTLDGVSCVFSGLPIPFFNVALVTATRVSDAAVRAHARAASAWAADKAVPWFFIVTEETLAPGLDVNAVLDDSGFTPVLTLTGMRAPRLAPTGRVPHGLRLDVAGDNASCVSAFDVNAAAYAMNLDACKPPLATTAFWAPHTLVLGRAAGAPVTCAAVLMVEGCRYVAFVATAPGQQRRGYAEAAMRHALDVSAARFGDRPTTLHATDVGRPIYERMGYEPIASHLVYIEKRFVEGH